LLQSSLVRGRVPTAEEGRLVGAAIARGEALEDIVGMLVDRQIDEVVAARFVHLAEDRIVAHEDSARRIALLRARRSGRSEVTFSDAA